jgi:hypothetical protein
MSAPAPRLIRSYHDAFSFEGTISGFGDLRLPRPVPIRAVVYLGAIEVLLLAAASLPLIGAPIACGWEIRYVLAPIGLAWLFSVARVEGRGFHVAIRAWGRHLLSGKQLAGGFRPVHHPGAVWRPAPVVLVGDGRHGAPVRRLKLRGPGRVLLRYPCTAVRRGMLLEVTQTSSRPSFPGRVLGIADGATVKFPAGAEG